jgi:hypothetical protein
LALFLGCEHDKNLKPPKEDAAYRLPPADDARYSSVPKFPDKEMNKFPNRVSLGTDDGPGRMPMTRVPGTGAGMPGQ